MIRPGVIASAGVPLATPAQVQRTRTNFETSTYETALSSAPTAGNLLVVFGYGSDTAPSGFTAVASAGSPNQWVLAVKDSDGSEQTVTLTGASRREYQEWSGMAAAASVYDGTNSTTTVAEASSFDPASTTGDQNRAVYLCLLGMSNTATVGTDWTGCDATYNTGLLLGGHKIVTDGAAFDTSVTWSPARFARGGLFVLRGES